MRPSTGGHPLVAAPHRRPAAPALPPERLPTTQQLVKESCTVVSALSLEQALACKTGRPLLARSLWAGFRQPRRRSFFGQVIGIPHSNRLLVTQHTRRLP